VITPLPIVRTRAGARHVSPRARRPVAACGMRRGMWVRRGSVAGRRHCRCPRRGRAHGATHAFVRGRARPGQTWLRRTRSRSSETREGGRKHPPARLRSYRSVRSRTFVLVQLGMPAACIHIDRYMPLRTNHSFMLVCKCNIGLGVVRDKIWLRRQWY
jgi:hypothetical protein